jgi:hydrogenase/urease accessory protein HupE
MTMQNFHESLDLKNKLLAIMGALLGGGITWVVITQLPIAQASIISSILLAGLVVACAHLSNRVLWWMAMGAIASTIIALGGVMAGHLAEQKEPLEQDLRLVFIVSQSMAGLIAGVILGRRMPKANLPTLRDFLEDLGGLAVGLYAFVVTSRFVEAGLLPAQDLKDRLDAATTVLITLLVIPGALGYLLTHRESG